MKKISFFVSWLWTTERKCILLNEVSPLKIKSYDDTSNRKFNFWYLSQTFLVTKILIMLTSNENKLLKYQLKLWLSGSLLEDNDSILAVYNLWSCCHGQISVMFKVKAFLTLTSDVLINFPTYRIVWLYCTWLSSEFDK